MPHRHPTLLRAASNEYGQASYHTGKFWRCVRTDFRQWHVVHPVLAVTRQRPPYSYGAERQFNCLLVIHYGCAYIFPPFPRNVMPLPPPPWIIRDPICLLVPTAVSTQFKTRAADFGL